MMQATAPSRMELLVLSTIARRPMHGYEIKLELRYRHVRWWAKCEHSHLYATLARLQKAGDLEAVAQGGLRGKRVFAITDRGRRRLHRMMREIGRMEDGTYFDIDLFLAGSYTLSREEAVEILGARREALTRQLEEARALRTAMEGHVPLVALLIMEHRTRHLELEVEFGDRAIAALRDAPTWGPFLGAEAIGDFLKRHKVPLEGG